MDTINDAASLDVAALRKVKLDELPEAAGVVVVNGLGVPECFHDRTVKRRGGGGHNSQFDPCC